MVESKNKNISKVNVINKLSVVDKLIMLRESMTAWTDRRTIKSLPPEVAIIKTPDTYSDKERSIVKKYGKLKLNIRFDGMRKGFFISDSDTLHELQELVNENYDNLRKVLLSLDKANNDGSVKASIEEIDI